MLCVFKSFGERARIHARLQNHHGFYILFLKCTKLAIMPMIKKITAIMLAVFSLKSATLKPVVAGVKNRNDKARLVIATIPATFPTSPLFRRFLSDIL